MSGADRPHDSNGDLAGVARGGTANLIGAAVYGLSNFVLLVVLNRGLGVESAGVVVVAIAIFNILAVVGGLGAATGLVRFISQLRAGDAHGKLIGLLRVALGPVAVTSIVAGLGLWLAAPPLAGLFAEGERADEVIGVLRWMAPFVPFATLQSVVVQATRGFDTMGHQVRIEKIGRSIAMPVAAGAATVLGAGPRGAAIAWAATNTVALVFSARALRRLVGRDLERTGTAAGPIDRETARSFWGFTGPRAMAQVFDVSINWFGTIVVGALLTTTKAGIFASGTRYLQPGLFAADAMLQVTSPKLSALLARGRTEEASLIVKVVAGWQVAVMWPAYLLVVLFPTPLLRVFGDEVVQARGALVILGLTMLAVAVTGPTGAVIMMAGRSRHAMFNSFVGLVVNIAGNLVFVPEHGIVAAGAVWAATILVVQGLSVWQSHRTVGVATFGRPALLASLLALATIGAVGLAARFALGDGASALAVTVVAGGALYVFGLARARAHLHLDTWWNGLRRRRTVP